MVDTAKLTKSDIHTYDVFRNYVIPFPVCILILGGTSFLEQAVQFYKIQDVSASVYIKLVDFRSLFRLGESPVDLRACTGALEL